MPLIEPVARCRKFNALSRHGQWFYLQLKLHLDPAGRHDAHPGILNSTLFPLRKDVRDTDISRWLHECERAGLLRCYADTQGRAVVEVFDARQTRMKSIRSDYDPPEGQMPLLQENHNSRTKPVVRKRKEEKEGKGGGQGPDVRGQNNLDELRTGLNEMYRRGEQDRWSYAEETALTEVCSRSAALEEWEHIQALRKSMPVEDRKRFFPQTVHSLLSRWTETLDRARIQTPMPGPRSKVQSPKSRPETAPVTAATLRESVAYLENNCPDSESLPLMRKRLAELEAKPERSQAA